MRNDRTKNKPVLAHDGERLLCAAHDGCDVAKLGEARDAALLQLRRAPGGRFDLKPGAHSLGPDDEQVREAYKLRGLEDGLTASHVLKRPLARHANNPKAMSAQSGHDVFLNERFRVRPTLLSYAGFAARLGLREAVEDGLPFRSGFVHAHKAST